MSYEYQAIRPQLFTEAGQVLFMKIRDNIQRILKMGGAVRMQEAIGSCVGDIWMMFACIDRLVELNEIREITTGQRVAGQHRVFVSTVRL